MMNKWIATMMVLSAFGFTLRASEFETKIRASHDAGDPVPTDIFKICDKVEVHYFAPTSPREPGNNPALVYIHGGGWKGGTPLGSYRWCRYLAEHGVSAFTVRYQLANEKQGIKPINVSRMPKPHCDGCGRMRINSESIPIRLVRTETRPEDICPPPWPPLTGP